MEKTKADIMQDLLVKLEDIENTQKSLIEKISMVQVELYNEPDEELDAALSKVFTSISESLDVLKLGIEDYNIKRNVIINQ